MLDELKKMKSPFGRILSKLTLNKYRSILILVSCFQFSAALLEQENMKLRLELSQLKQETAKLRCIIHATS
jgi:hypothetical protein